MPGLFVVMMRSASMRPPPLRREGGIERTDPGRTKRQAKTARRLYRISSPAANLQKPPPARLDLHDGRRCGYVRQPGLHIGKRRGRYACMLGRKAQPRLVSVIIVSVETQGGSTRLAGYAGGIGAYVRAHLESV